MDDFIIGRHVNRVRLMSELMCFTVFHISSHFKFLISLRSYCTYICSHYHSFIKTLIDMQQLQHVFFFFLWLLDVICLPLWDISVTALTLLFIIIMQLLSGQIILCHIKCEVQQTCLKVSTFCQELYMLQVLFLIVWIQNRCEFKSLFI